MTGRSKTAARRLEIVDAALALLADTPLSALTTRQIAKRLNLSQPALFRHFRSREQLLVAVVERARSVLASLASEVVAAPSPAEAIERLVLGLFAHVEAHPGLPRLLFSEAATADCDLGRALSQLVAAQLQLAAELIRAGQRDGTIRAGPPRQLASLLIALIQGSVLQWQRGSLNGPLSAHGSPLLAVWLTGAGGDGVRGPEATAGPGSGLEELDARPILARGGDPLDEILAALDRAGSAGLLVLTAPFRPAPLITLVEGRGCATQTTQLGPKLWVVEIAAADAPAVEDLRDLPAPAPLERVLAATAELGARTYLAHVPRVPQLLLPRLTERGLTFRVAELPDGSALLHVRGPAE